ncbi:hypothetical protein BDW62DRAFT_179457 [Aspergillus aurantiobrunneus]
MERPWRSSYARVSLTLGLASAKLYQLGGYKPVHNCNVENAVLSTPSTSNRPTSITCIGRVLSTNSRFLLRPETERYRYDEDHGNRDEENTMFR